MPNLKEGLLQIFKTSSSSAVSIMEKTFFKANYSTAR